MTSKKPGKTLTHALFGAIHYEPDYEWWSGKITMPSWAVCCRRWEMPLGLFGRCPDRRTRLEKQGVFDLGIRDKFERGPSPEQEQAFRYVQEHEAALLASVLKKLAPYVRRYYFRRWLKEREGPVLERLSAGIARFRTPESFADLLSPPAVDIYETHARGTAYVSIRCGCGWDPEHGVEVLMHKSRVKGLSIIGEFHDD